MVTDRAMVLAAVADIVHGVGRPRMAARGSARAEAPACRVANHSRQTSTIAIIAICNVVAVMNCHSSECQKYATLCAARATCAGRYGRQYGDSVH
jgi:hypothetical protein